MRRLLENFLVDTAAVVDYFGTRICNAIDWLVENAVKTWNDPFVRMLVVWFIVLVLVLLR